MASFFDLVNKQKAAATAKAKTNEVSFRGSGLTKRLAEQSERAYERESQSSMQSQEGKYVAAQAAKQFSDEINADVEVLRVAGAQEDITLDPSQIDPRYVLV